MATTLKAKGCVAQSMKIYNYYISPCRHVKNIEEIITKDRATLSCESSSLTIGKMDKETSRILENISVLESEKWRVVDRFGLLRILLTPKCSILASHLLEMVKVEGSMTLSTPIELKEIETTSYALNGLIHANVILIRSLAKEMKILENSFQDVLKLVSKH